MVAALSLNELDTLPVVTPETVNVSTAAAAAKSGALISFQELELTLIILLFGILSLTLFYFLVRSKLVSPFLMRMYVVLILVFGTLLVVSSSFATDQIAPVVGFFGTIAGYLLGRSERANDAPPTS